MSKSGLNKYQIAVTKVYGGGDFAHFDELDADQYALALRNCGDTLFKFLMIELADEESCEHKMTKGEAALRLARAANDMQSAWFAVESVTEGTT